MPLESHVRQLIARHVDFDFDIDYNSGKISFFRKKDSQDNPIAIRISRGEENIFVWCFFIAVIRLIVEEKNSYRWVKYIWIDDPVSSLDDNNSIAFACQLAQLLKKSDNRFKTVVSSHHALFFNVMQNEFRKVKGASEYFFDHTADGGYSMRDMKNNLFFHHVASLRQLHEAVNSGKLYSVHPKIADFRELATGAGQISCHIGRKMDWSGEILPVLRADFGGIGVHLCLLRRNRTYLWHSPEFGTSSIRKKGGMHAYAASFRRRFAFLMISCSRSSLPSRWTLAARIAVATTRAKPSRLVSRTRFQPR